VTSTNPTDFPSTSEVLSTEMPGEIGLGGLKPWQLILICIAAAIILILIIILGILIAARRRRQRSKQTVTKRNNNTFPVRSAPEPPPKMADIMLPIQMSENGSVNSLEKITNTNTIMNANGFNHLNALPNNSYQESQHGSYGSHQDQGSQHGSQPSLSLREPRELNPAALSPIQSWDAKYLLDHWGRVQEAKQRHEVPPVMRIEDLETSSSREGRHSAYSSEDENMANNMYTRPDEDWRYDDIRQYPPQLPPHQQVPNNYNNNSSSLYAQPFWQRSNIDQTSNAPSDNIPAYSTVNRRPTATAAVSQV